MQLRIPAHNDYWNIRALWDECFPEDSDAWRDWYFDHVYKPENTFALFENSVPVSMAQINEYNMVLNHKPIKAYTLAGVSTSKAFRRRGYADQLVKESLKEMYRRNTAYSFLYPFNYNFYLPYGYRTAYSVTAVESEPGPSAGMHYQISDVRSMDDLAMLYEEYAAPLNGYVVRSSDYFKTKLLEYSADHYDIETVMEGGHPIAYIIGRHEQDHYKLDEFVCIADSKKVLMHVAEKIGGKVRAALPYNPSLPGVRVPHCMGRVINFKLLFEGIPCSKCNLKVGIQDSIVQENSGIWNLSERAGRLTVEKTKGAFDLMVDIGELAPAATGAYEYMSENAMRFCHLVFGSSERFPWLIEIC